MEVLYHDTNRIIQEIQQCFQQLTISQSGNVENQITLKLASANANFARLDVLVFKVPAPQRPNAKMRVDQLKYDVRHLTSALQSYQQKQSRKEQEQQEREHLLSRRFSANPETSIDIDYSLQHHSSMNNAHQGNNVLGNLRSQRDTLKGAQKRILDIGNTLGLSNHTMRLIERRIHEDKYVVFGGMAVTTTIIFLVIYYFVL